jgi:hypothetical protein
MLNVRSWNERYPDDIVTDEEAERWYKIKISCKSFKNDYELLKTLQFLNYNIDIKKENMSYKERLAVDFLESAINMTISYILNNIPEYRVADWG